MADARTDTTEPGELGGVVQLATALKGPAPAVFNAWRETHSVQHWLTKLRKLNLRSFTCPEKPVYI